MSPSAYIEHLAKVDVGLSIQISIEETASDYTELQRGQLSKGMKADGTYLPDYSPSSVARGKPAGPIRLYDTGAFYSGMMVDVRETSFIITSADWKAGLLENKWNPLGLADENGLKYKRALQPVLVKNILSK